MARMDESRQGGAEESRPLRVLLVEDDPDIAEVTQYVLESAGMQVTTSSEGREALARLEVLRPDVIVTDLMMPVLDGLEMLRRYRERPGPHAPVLAVSASTVLLERATAGGAAGVLAKPYRVEQLVRRVRHLAARASGRAARRRTSSVYPRGER